MSEINQSKGIQHFPSGMFDLELACETALPPRPLDLTVGWGDCDPAQIAYTARIPDWSLTAVEDWYRYCLSLDWYEINLKRGYGTPFVSLQCDFRAPVTPQFNLNMKVFVSRLGGSSISHYLEGWQNGVLCFTTKTTAAFVEANTMKPVSIPPNMRSNIENYIRNQGREFS